MKSFYWWLKGLIDDWRMKAMLCKANNDLFALKRRICIDCREMFYTYGRWDQCLECHRKAFDEAMEQD